MSMEVVIYACQQAVPDPETLRSLWSAGEVRLRVLPEPCSSKVEVFQLLRTLATPVDLVWVIGCEEQLCRFNEGSHRAGGRMSYTKKYLLEIGLEPARVGRSLLTPGDESALAAIVSEISGRLKSLGPSPLRRAPNAGAHLAAP
ncbi:MAG: hydrogenase iron-sulfur subunit [Thermodesulfobacteriota bacterium]